MAKEIGCAFTALTLLPSTLSDIDVSLDGQNDWLCVHCPDSAAFNYIECTKCHELMHWTSENLTEEIHKSHVENPDSENICLLGKNDELNEAEAQNSNVDSSTMKSQPAVYRSDDQSSSLVSNTEALAQGHESPMTRHQIEDTIVKESFIIPSREVLSDNVAPTQSRIPKVQDPDDCDRLSPISSMSAKIPIRPIDEQLKVCVSHDNEHSHADMSTSTGFVV